VFRQPGVHEVTLTVSDGHGKSTTERVQIAVGNEPPAVGLTFAGNQTFYWPGKPVQYQVRVEDREDGSLAGGTIAADQVLVTLDHLDMGTDLTFVAQGQQQASQVYLHPGLELINKSDCRSCHHPEETSVGPAYRQVALRYGGNQQAVQTLSEKIIKGGNGNWGQTAMAAHPQLKPEEAAEMVRYILSLGREAGNRRPPQGSFTPADSSGNYLFGVTYRDKGGPGIGPQVGQRQFLLRAAKVPAVACDDYRAVAKFNNAYVKFTEPGAYICFKGVDLTGLRKITYALPGRMPGHLELHLDDPAGPVVNRVEVSAATAEAKTVDASAQRPFRTSVEGKLEPTTGVRDLYLVYREAGNAKASMWNSFDLAWLQFE
jgi:cytochrome c